MKFVIIGLSITSSWGNGHATTYRGLVRELDARGHEVLFLERDQCWYADNRDLAEPEYCRVGLYRSLEDLRLRFAGPVAEADCVLVGSYVPDGKRVGDWVMEAAEGVTAFYDIDTPVTIGALRGGRCEYLSPEQIPHYDFYLSFTGGPTLETLEWEFGARHAVAFYCSFDPALYYPDFASQRWNLGYLGTYSPDRQPALERLLLEPARCLPQGRFMVAGAQYPREILWPGNVQRIAHLSPDRHRAFYNGQRFTLNLTRSAMIRLGWSPSVRLFEAAACGTPVISDTWPGLDSFFTPGFEILTARNAEEVKAILQEMAENERWAIGQRARARVLREHTAAHRALQLERLVRSSRRRSGRETGPTPSAEVAL